MGRRKKGQSQRNPLPPQACPRLPIGFWRRLHRQNPAPRHGIPTRPGQGDPTHGCLASETREIGAPAGWDTRISWNPSPAQVSRKQARPAPSPNTHSPAAPERPAQALSPRHSAPIPVPSPRPSPSGRQPVPGAPGRNLCSLPPQREGQQRGVDARTASRTARTH